MLHRRLLAFVMSLIVAGIPVTIASARNDVPGDWIPGPWHAAEGQLQEDRFVMEIDEVLMERIRNSARIASRVLLGDVVLPGGARVDLDLEVIPSSMSGAEVVVMKPGGRGRLTRRIRVDQTISLGGKVLGDPDGEAFIAFGPVGIEGWIRHDGVAYGISDGPRNGVPMAVRLDSLPPLDPELLDNFCSSDLLTEGPRPVVRPVLAGEVPDQGGIAGLNDGECRRLRLAFDTDVEFLGLFGGDVDGATSYISTLCAAMSFIYSRDVNVVIVPNWVRLWVGGDPWNQENTSNQLTEFRSYWEANEAAVTRDLAHFLSGRGLGGGVAWLPGVCGSYAYGLSANLGGSFPYPIENNNGSNWDLMVVSHEIGHNCGAPHTHSIGVDDCAGGDCSVTPNGTIMSYCHLCAGGLANMRMEFCPENIVNINATFDTIGCTYEVSESTQVLPDAATTYEGVPVAIDAAGNDVGIGCTGSNIISFDETSFAGGVLTRIEDWIPNGRDAILYTPAAGFIGTDTFSYTVRMGSDFIDGFVTVTVLDSDFRDPEDPSGTTPGVAADFYVVPFATELPDFSTLEAFGGAVHGRIDFPSTGGQFAETGLSDDFGVVWNGWIDIPASGFWTLGTESDDGSRLYIGDQLVVDNDGLHGMQSRSGTIGLGAGRHAIRVEFFERAGGAGCIVLAGGPGMDFDVIPESMWSHGESTDTSPDLDGDGLVTGADLGLLLVGWGGSGPSDLDQDGTTNGADLGLLLAAWSTGP